MKAMQEWTKMCLYAFGVSLFAGLGMYWLSFSDNPAAVAVVTVVTVAIVVAIVVVAIVAVAIVFNVVVVAVVTFVTGDFYLAISLVFLALAFGAVALGSWDKEKKDFSAPKSLMLLAFLVWNLLPCYYVSQYHNGQQIVKDKIIATKFEARQNNAGQSALFLPDSAAGFQRYLSQILKVRVAGQDYSWRAKAIRCLEGEKEWYQLPLPASTEPLVVGLRFDHAWQDYETTLTLPVAKQYADSGKVTP